MRTPRWLIACGILSTMLVAGCGSATSSTVSGPAAAPTPSASAAPASDPPLGSSPVTTSACGSLANPCTAPSPTLPTEPTETSPVPTTEQPRAGSYIDYAAYEKEKNAVSDTKVVLFFHAPWCPICVGVEKTLTSAPIPPGLTVVKVDFDSALELRQRYGVTIQHTFVQVDPSGRQLAKWSEGTAADQILGKTV